MKVLLLYVLLGGFLFIENGEVSKYNYTTKQFDTYNSKGEKVGTVKKSILPNEYNVYDNNGRKSGTAKWDSLTNEWRVNKKGE